MNPEPQFITLEDALYFHKQEIQRAGGATEIRDSKALEAALSAPQASFGGDYLMDIFAMAATYVEAICTHHPFLDGNKRTGAASALAFLYLNGYELTESYDEELADKVLALVTHRMVKEELAEYFKANSTEVS